MRTLTFATWGLACGLIGWAAGLGLSGPTAVTLPGLIFGLLLAFFWRNEAARPERLAAALGALGLLSGAFAAAGIAVGIDVTARLEPLVGRGVALLAAGFAAAGGCSAAWRVFTAGVPWAAERSGLTVGWPNRSAWAAAILGSVATGALVTQSAAGPSPVVTPLMCCALPATVAAVFGLCRPSRDPAAVGDQLAAYVGQST